MNRDEKFNMKIKAKNVIIDKINKFTKSINKIKPGRPNSLSVSDCVDAILHSTWQCVNFFSECICNFQHADELFGKDM